MELKFDELVGRGAAGQVWRATDELDRVLAVKFFNDDTPSRMERDALVHAKALARVKHPSVVGLICIDRVEHPETKKLNPALIMEYIDGPPLSMLDGFLEIERAIRLMRQIADAIDAIHAAGIVHGDLHDGNVLIAGNEAKVVDILYTRSLAEVGEKTAVRDRDDDLRDLAKVLHQIANKTAIPNREIVVSGAYLRASSSCSGREVFEIYEAALRPISALLPGDGSPVPQLASSGTTVEVTAPAQESVMTERLVHAMERLWKAALAFRVGTPGALIFLDVVTETEYPGALETLRGRGELRGITDESVHQALFLNRNVDIEDVRPVIGEELWNTFHYYRAFLGRCCFLVIGTIGKGGPWYRDEATLRLLSGSIGSSTVQQLLRAPVSKFGLARDAFERIVLDRVRPVLSTG